MNKTISVIGGDMRQTILADMLANDSYDVTVFGFDNTCDINNVNIAENIFEASKNDIIILPLPVSYDNINLNAPLASEEIKIRDILDNISDKSILLGGRISEYLEGEFDALGIEYCDYFMREELIVQNAIPTAEGAIEIAMSEMPITLHSCRALILGFGRIGKVLAKMLSGIGANVTVSARRYETLSWIHTLGYKGINNCRLSDSIGSYDVIFNTVPSMILDKQLLRNINKKTLIIDLASKPGGVGFLLEGALFQNITYREMVLLLHIPAATATISVIISSILFASSSQVSKKSIYDLYAS